MNSLILTLDAGAGCCLPIAYQQLTQGALYAAWRGSYPQLHDEGFAGDRQTFRLFTFGPLEGRYRVQGNEITFTGLVQLEVRSPVEDLLYALGKSLTGAGALRLGRCVLPLRDLRSEDHYWFAAPLPVRMVSPLTLHKSLPGGKTLFLRPDDDAFAAQLIANTAHKLAACPQYGGPVRHAAPDGDPPAAQAGDTVQGHLPDRLGGGFSAGRRPGDALPFVPDRLGGPQQPGLWHVPDAFVGKAAVFGADVDKCGYVCYTVKNKGSACTRARCAAAVFGGAFGDVSYLC